MRNLTTEEVSVFTYEEWLSRTRGPKRTMICEMAAVVDEEVMVEETTYTIQVKTGDVAGSKPPSELYCLAARVANKRFEVFLASMGTLDTQDFA